MDRGELLSGEARAFLQAHLKDLTFPEDGLQSDDAAAVFLARERTRLSEAGDIVDGRVATEDVRLEGDLLLRLYRPVAVEGTLPTVLYLHGGGWVSGSVQQHDATCNALATTGGVVVANLDYRLAPEHPYPAAHLDCLQAIEWLQSNVARRMGGDPARLCVAGSSSGGGLAASLTLALARRDVEVALQLLIYPALDSLLEGRSYLPEENGTDYFVSRDQMAWYWEQYAGGPASEIRDPAFTPWFASSSDLAALPPTIIVAAEYDTLRDDALEYHRRLREAGIPTRMVFFPGQIHGFMGLIDVLSEAAPAIRACARMTSSILRDGPKEFWWDKH